MRPFEDPQRTLGDLDPKTAAALVGAASDLALVVDDEGVIRDLAVGSDELPAGDVREWLGRPWLQTVTVESRPKVEAALRELAANRAVGWRHLNHPLPQGGDLPLMVTAVPIGRNGGAKTDKGRKGRAVVFGRDLRGSAALQQQLVGAQQAMERDYWRMRHMETRYRSLFQLASEAVLIVDATSGKLEEANPAAQRLLGDALRRNGWTIDGSVADGSQAALGALLASVRSTGRGGSVSVQLEGVAGAHELAASLFRQEKSTHLLLRLSPREAAARGAGQDEWRRMQRLIDAAPDGFVVTDGDGRALGANAAFLELAQLASAEQLNGASLERWVGRTGVDLRVLLNSLRQNQVVRLFATIVRGEYGSTSDVEISAVAVEDDGRTTLGFTVRDIGRRLFAADSRAAREMPRSVGQMTELVGRVPLKDIVRETTDLIEQLCIEAALQLTADNRASAAEMLGLSRQSLYVKMRRFNMGDLGGGADE
jgi:transcriptional regulator PpsR